MVAEGREEAWSGWAREPNVTAPRRARSHAPVFGNVPRAEPGGRLGRHPATDPQILAILEGSGEVSGANGDAEPIEAGEAVYLHEGEEHEMKSAAGLTALIIEGERLDRFRGRPTAPSAPE